MAKFQIFLSYSRRDTQFMQLILQTLRVAGFQVWVDINLTPGTPSWASEVEKALDNTRCVVVLLSPSAKKSEWVKRELEYAHLRKIRIFPILVRGTARESIPLSVAGTHYIDLRKEENTGLRNLIAAISEL